MASKLQLIEKSSQDLGIVGKTYPFISHFDGRERGEYTQPRFLAVGVARKLAIWQRLPILAMEKRVFPKLPIDVTHWAIWRR